MSSVEPKAFVTVEKALVKTLAKSFIPQHRKWVKKIKESVNSDDISEARSIIDSLDLSSVYSDNIKRIRILSNASFMFGASRINSPNNIIAKTDKDKTFNKAVDNFKSQVDRVSYWVIKAAHRVLDQLEEGKIQKAEKVRDFVSFINDNTKKAGLNSIQIGASNHNSRLAQYGFLVEATLNQVTNYRINTINDNRRSEICELMDGRTFSVEKGLSFSRKVLTIEDAEEFRSSAPFPNMDKDSLEQYSRMSDQELEAAGFSVPPFHHLCRSYLDVVQSMSTTNNITQDRVFSPEASSNIASSLNFTEVSPNAVSTVSNNNSGIALSLLGASALILLPNAETQITSVTQSDIDLVREMLVEGVADIDIIDELALSPEELSNIKEILGFSQVA